MGYLQARSDLEFMQRFREDMMTLLNYEGKALEKHKNELHRLPFGVRRKEMARQWASANPEYVAAREAVCKGLLRARKIALGHGVSIVGQSVPPAAVGGVIVPFDVFGAALNDNTHHGVMPGVISDALDQTTGACEDYCDRERRNLINPLYWLREALSFVLRVPFMLIEATGFDVAKVEDQLVGRVFKLIEVVVIVYVLLRLGVTKAELVELVNKLMP